jgi:hypothetical protein
MKSGPIKRPSRYLRFAGCIFAVGLSIAAGNAHADGEPYQIVSQDGLCLAVDGSWRADIPGFALKLDRCDPRSGIQTLFVWDELARGGADLESTDPSTGLPSFFGKKTYIVSNPPPLSNGQNFLNFSRGGAVLTEYVSYSFEPPPSTFLMALSGEALPQGRQLLQDEGKSFSISTAADVMFGASSPDGTQEFNTRTVGPGPVACATTKFGDPIYGTVKGCYMWINADSGQTASNWWPAGLENSTQAYFDGSASRLVRYGASGNFHYRQMPGSQVFHCDNATFGDPIYGTVKRCDVLRASIAITIQNSAGLCLQRNSDASATYPVTGEVCRPNDQHQVWKLRPMPSSW